MLSITLTIKHSIKKFWNYGNHLMNPLNSFTHAFVILHTDPPKIILIGNCSMGDLSIFFTYLNPTHNSSVMELRNHRQAQSLSQVTVHLHLIK